MALPGLKLERLRRLDVRPALATTALNKRLNFRADDGHSFLAAGPPFGRSRNPQHSWFEAHCGALRAITELGGFGVTNREEPDPSSRRVCAIGEISHECSKELGWPKKAQKREPPQASHLPGPGFAF